MTTTTEQEPTIAPARYAKGKVVMSCPKDGTGYKTRAAALAEAFGGRWVHRSHGYVMAPSRAAEALRLWHLGYNAHLRMFAHDKRRTAELLIPPAGEIQWPRPLEQLQALYAGWTPFIP